MTQIVLPADTNPAGTIFGGTVMSWMDIAAAIAAARHSRKYVVTASVDALHFLSPIHLGAHVEIKAMVNFVSRMSMEVGVRVNAQNPLTGEELHTLSAYFTFVALNEKSQPVLIDQLYPESEEEIKRFHNAKKRYQTRQNLAKERKKQAPQ
jgi:acyl-CoA hydrolase